MLLTHPRRAPRRTPAGIAVATCLAVVLLGGCGSDDEPDTAGSSTDAPSETASETPSDSGSPTGDDDVTRLAAGPAAVAGRCLPPTAENLAGAEVAVDATVTAVSRREVELTPTRWYAGEQTETVVVGAVPEVLTQLLQAVELEEGERYLVAADDRGTVMVCGFSDTWSPRLERTYAAAFGDY